MQLFIATKPKIFSTNDMDRNLFTLQDEYRHNETLQGAVSALLYYSLLSSTEAQVV